MSKILIFDGAMGTMLQQRGLLPGQSPEELNLTMPDVVESVHADYLQAGADIVTTNTFGGSRFKLREYDLEEQVAQINQRAVEIARAACQKAGHGKVAASLGPTGYFVSPVGDTSFDEMYQVYREQADAIAAAQPDYFLLETFSDLGETRAALLACLDAGQRKIPVICSMTYTNGRTLTGVSPAVAAVTLEAMGAYGIGCNCSGGPQELQQVIAVYPAAADDAAQRRIAPTGGRAGAISPGCSAVCSFYGAVFTLSDSLYGRLLRHYTTAYSGAAADCAGASFGTADCRTVGTVILPGTYCRAGRQYLAQNDW